MRFSNTAPAAAFNPFQRLIFRLEALLSKLEQADQYHSWLEPIDTNQIKSDLAELLVSLRSYQPYTADVASNSYWHDNGFLKLVLGNRTGSVVELRIHAWGLNLPIDSGPAALKPPFKPSNIHSHTSDFASIVLVGAMREQTFVDGPKAETSFTAQRHICTSRMADGLYSLVSDGPASLIASKTTTLGVGDTHSLRHSVLHQVTPLDGPTVTIFAQGTRRARTSSVYLAGNEAQKTRVFDTPALSSEIAVEAMGAISDLLRMNA